MTFKGHKSSHHYPHKKKKKKKKKNGFGGDAIILISRFFFKKNVAAIYLEFANYIYSFYSAVQIMSVKFNVGLIRLLLMKQRSCKIKYMYVILICNCT